MNQQYTVHLEIFEGPLDLLLYLIKKNDMDIYDIPISQITGEYLEYLDLMKELNLDVASEFLVMAATLMQIKSQMLLPKQPKEEEEGPDPREELVKKLLEYQKYKYVGQILSQKELQEHDVFYKTGVCFSEEDYILDVNIFDLIECLKQTLNRLPPETKEIVYEEIPIEQKIREILDYFENKEYINFKEILLKQTTKIKMIVTFLALLELIRLKQVVARQAKLFGEIRIYKVN